MSLRGWVLVLLLGACTDGAVVDSGDSGDTGDRPGHTDTDGPSVYPSVDVIDFGKQRMGEQARPQDVWLQNTSPVTLEFLDAATIPENQGFYLDRDPTGGFLEPDATARLTVRWRPLRVGEHEGRLVIDTTANPEGAPIEVVLLGEGVAGALRVDPDVIELPRREAARVPVTLSNVGDFVVLLEEVGAVDNPGLTLDLDPRRNGELPIEVAPTDEGTGLPVRTVYLDYAPELDDGPSEVTFTLMNDGYLDPERALTVRLQ